MVGILLSLEARNRTMYDAQRFKEARDPNFIHRCITSIYTGKLNKLLTVTADKLEKGFF